MKRLFAVVLMLLILCAVPASAETRYILPEGWSYNSAGQIVSPHGDVYDSIWDHDCMFALQCINWGYGDVDYMENYLRIDSATPELGDGSVSMTILVGAAAASLAGAAYSRKQARNAA